MKATCICERGERRSAVGVHVQWSFVQQGTPARDLYVITDGTARIYRDRVQIAELGPGDIVGEMALFGNGQRQASVSSVSRFRGVRTNCRELTRLLHRSPQLESVIRDVSNERRRRAG